MQIAQEVQGIIAVLVSGVFFTLNLMLSKLLQSWTWPYFFLTGLSALLITIGLIAVILLKEGRAGFQCQPREVKWIFMRGFFGSGNNILGICAALSGASVGSIGALSSVNTVVAALLGRLVLGEPLGKLQVLAVGLSFAGAVLISDPGAVMTDFQSHKSVLLGLLLALMAGVSLGVMFISTRKAPGASSKLLTVSAMAQRWVACWVLAFCPYVPDGTFGKFIESPAIAVSLFLCLLTVVLMSNLMSSVGSKMCPAAISSTVLTATSMGTGYLVDVFIFHKIPNYLTILGALMMLLAVVTVATARLPHRQQDAVATHAMPLPAGISVPASDESGPRGDSSQRSLASFIASEYAEEQHPGTNSADVATPALRYRSTQGPNLPVAVQLGALPALQAASC